MREKTDQPDPSPFIERLSAQSPEIDRIYLLHVQDANQNIIDYTAAGKDGFFAA